MQSEQQAQPDSPALAHFGMMGDEQLCITEGNGAYVTTENEETYLDFTSQLYCVNAGHGNDKIINRMTEQSKRIQYVSSAKGNDQRTALASRLSDLSPAGLEDVFFSISGSEANEAALQIAREFQDAQTVLTRWRSYHGSTYATAGITGDPAIRLPIVSHAQTTGTTKFLPPFAGADTPFDADTPEELTEQAADHLEYIIKNQGPDSIAALVTEVVGGSSGGFTAPPGYFDRVRELCDEYDILLIADEVITGFGRCGEWFGSQTEDLHPDMITFAKGVTSAYTPLAGVLMRPDIGERLRNDAMDIGQTFAGNPIACAAGLATMDVYEDLIPNVRRLAPELEDRIYDLQKHDVVGDIRGRGFLWAIEFIDSDTGDPVFDPRIEDGKNPVKDVIAVARDEGVLVGGGRPGFQIMVAPPFCIDQEHIDTAINTLDHAISVVFE